MPRRVDAAERRDRQLLLRLTAEELDWVESAAHLQRVSANTYIYELVQSHVTAVKTNEYVRADLRNRRAYADASSETLPLPSRSEPALADGGSGDSAGQSLRESPATES